MKRFALKRRTAFTLAEVLITLGIIGIVAAMTIPTLIGNIQDIQFRSQFYKSYSLIKQTLKKMEADDIPLAPGDYTNGSRYDDPFYRKFENYLTNINDSGIKEGAPPVTYQTLTGNSTYDSSLIDDGCFTLPGGSMIMFEQPGNMTVKRIWIYVDVNGVKLPNRLGRDLFVFQMTDDGLKPMGADGTSYDEDTYCNKTGSGNMNGIACAAKVIKDPQYFKWIKRVGD